jgi:pyridoxal phosphate enzyme (YggS family)
MEFIKHNLAEVEEKICAACKRAGRDRSEVTLIAVSKTKPVEMLEACMENGINIFGENKVQELCEKYEVLPKELHWHLIGHLQRNKVKYITDKAELIHSVDSLRLAEAISADAVKKGVNVDILIEVNVAEEDSKFGLKTEETENLIREISKLPNIFIKGLMTIAPYTAVAEENRPIFRTLKQLSVDIDSKNIDNVSMGVLSMGMTGDYEVAIEEGATMVRVGTGIFGERDYTKKL